jgi:ribosomal protein S18 acetylase RimI-like enzyme
MLSLRPMTEEEFEQFKGPNMEDYAQERSRNFDTPIEQERAIAADQYARFLKDGIHTLGQRLWVVTEETGAAVGHLWVGIEDAEHMAFIYFIGINADQRGKGYGAQTLDLLEEAMRPLGIQQIGLNVFSDNAVAQRLYARQGYRITNYSMLKQI